jgi:protein TonB
MFDLISGGTRHPFHDPTAAPVMVSIAGHVVVATLVVVLPLMYAADRLPMVPTMMAFVAAPAPPPPPPPPPPRPVEQPPQKAGPSRPQPPVTTGAFAAPLEAPSEIRPEPPGPIYSGGGEGGVEGGIEGGVAGGIVGGLVAAPPPPPALPPPPQAPRAPVRIGGAIQAPTLMTRVEPIYPEVALLAKVGGMVILEAVVRADGSVESVKVLRSVKFLDGAAIEAVKQWKYSPLVLNGVPTPFVLTVMLNFHTA